MMHNRSKPSRSLTIATAVVALSVAAVPLSAGVVLDLENIDHSGPEPRAEVSKLVVDGGRLKMDLASADPEGLDHSMIFRSGDDPEIVVVNHRQKTYQVMTRGSIAALGAEMRLAMAQALREVESLPPEQRAIVSRLLDSQLGIGQERPKPPPSTVVKTSERASHHGFECVKYDVFRGGERIREIWVAPWDDAPGSREVLAVLRDMSDFYSQLMETLEKLSVQGIGGGFGLDHHPFEELQHIDGFPVVTRSFQRGSLASEIVLRSFRQQELDAAELEPPADYRLVAMGRPAN